MTLTYALECPQKLTKKSMDHQEKDKHKQLHSYIILPRLNYFSFSMLTNFKWTNQYVQLIFQYDIIEAIMWRCGNIRGYSECFFKCQSKLNLSLSLLSKSKHQWPLKSLNFKFKLTYP
jgi:hypothetical protein